MKPEVFLTVKEAIDFINTDTRDNPTVDDVRLGAALEYLEQNQRGGEMNFNLFPIGVDANGKKVQKPAIYARLSGPREANELRYAIEDHIKSLSGRTINAETLGLHKKTTTIEDASGFQSRPRNNTNSNIKYMDDLSTGEGTQMVGA